MLRRRVVALTVLAWVPLLVLSIAEGRAWGTSVALPFLSDIEQHARFLVAMPLLIVAEVIVHRRMRPVLLQFLERGLIPDSAAAAFDDAITSAMRLRNSVLGRGHAHRVGLRCRRGSALADADRASRRQLARRAGQWDVAADDGRVVAWLR